MKLDELTLERLKLIKENFDKIKDNTTKIDIDIDDEYINEINEFINGTEYTVNEFIVMATSNKLFEYFKNNNPQIREKIIDIAEAQLLFKKIDENENENLLNIRYYIYNNFDRKKDAYILPIDEYNEIQENIKNIKK